MSLMRSCGGNLSKAVVPINATDKGASLESIRVFLYSFVRLFTQTKFSESRHLKNFYKAAIPFDTEVIFKSFS